MEKYISMIFLYFELPICHLIAGILHYYYYCIVLYSFLNSRDLVL